MKNLVNQGADVNTMIWNEWPCIHRLALFGLEDAFTFFLGRGADPNPPDVKISKPLYWAAGEGHESICRMLLDNEDETDSLLKPADYQAAFNQAVEKGSFNIVKMLWSRREVTLNGRDQYGSTPLQSAASKGHLEIVKFLIDQGCLREDHSQGNTAFISATSEGHLEILKFLCSEGKMNANARFGSSGRTALYCVAGLKDKKGREERREEMAKFLLDNGADPNRCDGEGPLHQAAMYGHSSMISLLLENSADPMKGGNKWSPLQTAISYGNADAVTLFLQCKISDGEANKAWLERSLLSAASGGHRDAVLQLLRAGANINTLQEKGYSKGATALLLAILSSQIKTAQLFIRQGARQDIADNLGRLPLSSAAVYGHDLLVRDLIRAGGDPNMKGGEDEDTPLIVAASKGYEKVVKVLLANGADKELTNKFGDTALDIAEERGTKALIELLEGYEVV